MYKKTPIDYKNAIESSGFDIYTAIEVGDAHTWIPTLHLETLLNQALTGLNLDGLPLRTRSKVVKIEVCRALGYPVPNSFKKTQPRFFGQQLDTYTQKSNNLQIWNEELTPTRRYAIIQISDQDVVLKVKVVNGQELALLDTTGTITTKYQARLIIGSYTHELISVQDTHPILPYVRSGATFAPSISPVDEPENGALLPIKEIFDRLSTLVGQSFIDPGMDQERNRGASLHRLICKCLGYSSYEDKGQFPDIRHQLLEVKLQTSPTIDLGLVLPSSEEHLDIKQLGEYHPRHCDTRYAMFYAITDGKRVTLTHLFVTTGADFFTRFRRFEGKVTNGKIQIPLPRNFFIM
ncbi:MAG: restriction endonuclease [Methylobacter sp.]